MEQYLPFKTVGLNMAQILENNKPARLFFFHLRIDARVTIFIHFQG